MTDDDQEVYNVVITSTTRANVKFECTITRKEAVELVYELSRKFKHKIIKEDERKIDE